jgi:hypothetical protein
MAAESNLGVGRVDLCAGGAPSARAAGFEACAPAFPAIANKTIRTQSIFAPPVLVAGKRQSSAFHL